MQNKFFTSGKLASLVGVSTDTLRHYERKGVLPRPRRSPGGYRKYPAEALERLQLIRRALSVGFTLDELAEILSVKDRGGNPCAEVRQLAAAKLADVETRLRELRQVRNQLRTTLTEWDQMLAKRPVGERAHLLEQLADHSRAKPHGSRNNLQKRRRKEKK